MKKAVIIFSFLILLWGCASSEIGERKDEVSLAKLYVPQVNLKVLETHCWLNVMPGGEARFNVSGKVEILNSLKYDFKTLELKEVDVQQSGKLIYSIVPTVIALDTLINSKTVAFSTVRGLGLVPNFNPEKNVSLKLIFEEGSERFSFLIENLKVEKIY
jgi:hypothetical protein